MEGAAELARRVQVFHLALPYLRQHKRRFPAANARDTARISVGSADEDGDRPLEVADETISASPERLTEQHETTALVRSAIARLSDEQREVIILRDIEGYTYDEIADMLSLEIGTVKSRLNRARTNLRSLLSDSDKSGKITTKKSRAL